MGLKHGMYYMRIPPRDGFMKFLELTLNAPFLKDLRDAFLLIFRRFILFVFLCLESTLLGGFL